MKHLLIYLDDIFILKQIKIYLDQYPKDTTCLVLNHPVTHAYGLGVKSNALEVLVQNEESLQYYTEDKSGVLLETFYLHYTPKYTVNGPPDWHPVEFMNILKRKSRS